MATGVGHSQMATWLTAIKARPEKLCKNCKLTTSKQLELLRECWLFEAHFFSGKPWVWSMKTQLVQHHKGTGHIFGTWACRAWPGNRTWNCSSVRRMLPFSLQFSLQNAAFCYFGDSQFKMEFVWNLRFHPSDWWVWASRASLACWSMLFKFCSIIPWRRRIKQIPGSNHDG